MSKDCKYCGKQITWDDSKKAFVNADGSKHDCRTQKIDKPTESRTEMVDAVALLEKAVRAIVRDEIRRMKT